MKKSTEVKAQNTSIFEKVGEKARSKTKKSPAKAHQELRAARAKLKQEHEARIKAEMALAEAQKELAAVQLQIEHEHQVQIKRTSFVVRLTLDEQGEIERTEVEHVSSSKKQNFISLDGERLVAFMKASIDPMITSDGIMPA